MIYVQGSRICSKVGFSNLDLKQNSLKSSLEWLIFGELWRALSCWIFPKKIAREEKMTMAVPFWYLALVLLAILLMAGSASLLISSKIEKSGSAAKYGRYAAWFVSLLAIPVVLTGFALGLNVKEEGGSMFQWVLLSSVVFWFLSLWSVSDARERKLPDDAFTVITVAALLAVIFTAYKSIT